MVGSDMLVVGLKNSLSIAKKVVVQAAGSTGSALRYAVMFLILHYRGQLVSGAKMLFFSPAELAERGRLCQSTLKTVQRVAM